MKFRLLFVLFNFVIVAAFALIVLMPAVVLGWEYSAVFWRANWPVGIVFVAVLSGLNVYFGMNWRLFSLLERQEWPRLIEHLEEKVLVRGRPGRQRVRVLINAYVVTGASEKISVLETRLRDINPAWISRFPLEFGIPYLLRNDAPAMERYFGEMRDNPRCAEPVWVRWNYAFALLLSKRADEGRAILVALSAEAKDPVQKLLVGYLLDSASSGDESAREAAASLRNELRTHYAGERWERALERGRGMLQVLVLSKLIEDAARWAFEEGDT